jgi:uncharacterized protein with von Willebrand factor type A (vWA) domain
VSPTETVDAADAVRHLPLEDREALKYGLGASLVKNHAHWQTFETVFEVYFALRGPAHELGADPDEEGQADPERQSGEGAPTGGGGGAEGVTPEELARLLYQALLEGDQAQVRALARQAVTHFAGMEPGRPVGGTYYLHRTLRRLGSDTLVERLLAGVRDQEGGELGALEEHLARDEAEARLSRLRQEIEAEIRRRLVADRGTEALARSLRRPLPEDVDFMHATQEELATLRRAIYPLTRRLAARLTRRRRHGRTGPLDFRSTVRHSLSYGGVPADPRFRHPTPAKPEIMVVADISGSVAAFARFTLQLVYAISAQFSAVRSFVFVDGVDEVTPYFEGADDLGEAIYRVNTEADVVWVDGHSDYGRALEAFFERWGEQVTARTSVIFLGDARNNYHASGAWVLGEVRQRARHLYWLNPEPATYWDTGDSIASQYARHCDGAFECRNLRQLEAFVGQLA